MSEAELLQIKAELDAALAIAAPDVAIAFGAALFAEFRRHGWLRLETLIVLGPDLRATKAPAYLRTHFAFPTWDLQDGEFKVGKIG